MGSSKEDEKQYPVFFSNAYLTPEHLMKIGSALALLLWCCDKDTRRFQDDAGVTWGKLLGGRPIKIHEIATTLGKSDKSIKRELKQLETHGYIRRRRTMYGYVIEVKNSLKKRDKFVLSGQDSSVLSKGQKCPVSRTEVSSLVDKSVTSNKTFAVNLIVRQNSSTLGGELSCAAEQDQTTSREREKNEHENNSPLIPVAWVNKIYDLLPTINVTLAKKGLAPLSCSDIEDFWDYAWNLLDARGMAKGNNSAEIIYRSIEKTGECAKVSPVEYCKQCILDSVEKQLDEATKEKEEKLLQRAIK